MKKVCLLLALFFAVPCASQAQEWAPAGAEWYYTSRAPFGPQVSYFRISATNIDSMILGKKCRKLDLSRNYYRELEYTYSDSGKVYFFDKSLDTFVQLYDFYADSGKSWVIRISNNEDRPIDSFKATAGSYGMINLNGKILRKQTVHCKRINYNKNTGVYVVMSHEAIENIGSTFYLFPMLHMLADYEYPDGLRCYSDSSGTYQLPDMPACTYVGIDEAESPLDFKIYPNPARDHVNIVLPDRGTEKFTVEVADLLGSVRYSAAAAGRFHTIPASSMPPGIYFLSISSTGKTYTKKVVIQ